MGKRKVNNRSARIDRNMKMGWQPMQLCKIPEDAEKEGVVAVFQNNRYTVFVKEMESPGFKLPDGSPMKIAHLVISRHDKKKIRDWDDMQRLKNECLHPMAEAVELYPGEFRRIDMQQTHLWALMPGATFPVGLSPAGGDAMAQAEQQALEEIVSKEELEVFTIECEIEGNKVLEVFASEEEAREMYQKAGNEFPENGTVKNIGQIPTPEEGAVWTENAKAKVANVLSKARKVADGMQAEVFDPDNEHRVEGELCIEDQMDSDFGYIDAPAAIPGEKTAEGETPCGVEEGVMLKEFMQMGIQKKERQMAEPEVEEEEDVEKEAAAAADLEKYRQELLKKNKNVN